MPRTRQALLRLRSERRQTDPTLPMTAASGAVAARSSGEDVNGVVGIELAVRSAA